MIKLASPDIREEDIEKVSIVLRSGKLIQGENVSLLEKDLERFSDIAHCAVVSSGTAALHLAIKALDISHGDKVIVPAFTFPATANAVINAGADVIFVDIQPDSYVVSPELIEKTVAANQQANLKAVIVVHEFGYPADIQSIREITDKYGLKLVEDAACALGTIADEHHPGYYSDMACLSFHPRKAITTGEGGAVLSNNKVLTDRIKVLRNHGIEYNFDQDPDFTAAGLNYRMTDFQASLAISQLTRFPDELAKRKKLAEVYYEILADNPRINLPQISKGHSWQSFMVVLEAPIIRSSVIKAMAEKGTETNLGAQALHQLKFFMNKYGHAAEDFKTAAALYKSGLVLPLYGKLQPADIEFISQTLNEVLSGL